MSPRQRDPAGVLLSLTLAPVWLVTIAKWNPGASPVWISLIIVTVLASLAVTWSVRVFSRLVRPVVPAPGPGARRLRVP